MNNIWLFGATKFQGNPKFLFTYINKYKKEISAFWIADTQEQVDYICALGYSAFLMNTEIANDLFSVADVYVVENFRESLPFSIHKQIKIINLWHGVGLKHVEFGLDKTSPLTDSVVKKNIRNFEKYRNNLAFLAPSQFMENHFIEEMRLNSDQMIRGVYPRNLSITADTATFDHKVINNKIMNSYDNVILYAPTYRDSTNKISIFSLFPEIEQLKAYLLETNSLFIFKLHHFEENSKEFLEFKQVNSSFDNFLFWEPEKDIYEIFHLINIAIVDYSSIFYDLLQADVNNIIRYVPDFVSYNETRGIKFDYMEYSGGGIAYNFNELISCLKNNNNIKNKEFLLDTFFGYTEKKLSDYDLMQNLIEQIENFKVKNIEYKKLYSFDVFDTLICRSTVEPRSVWFGVQEKLKSKKLGFSQYFINNYPQIRGEIESDLRDVYRKTTFERQSDCIEITFDEIFERLALNFSLKKNQIQFLKKNEVEYELEVVRPIPDRIEQLLAYAAKGHDIVLISDMYLPQDIIKKLINQADNRLDQFPLYVSSEIGHQKSTGKLYKHIFFDLDYAYSEWEHYGDNLHSDYLMAKKNGIKVVHHQMNCFSKVEKQILAKFNSFDGYKLASLFNKRRWELLDKKTLSFADVKYYAYAYAAPLLVTYVNWLISDAEKNKYKTLFFVSRDGYFLKKIAEVISNNREVNVKFEYIYGSRKAWRLASQVNEIEDSFFSEFGLFAGVKSYAELIKASQIDEEKLLSIIPALNNFKNIEFDSKNLHEIRSLFSSSDKYKKMLLELGVEKRALVEEYLKNRINFNEKFAFVDYWGRGYTQDLLSKILNNISDNPVITPFYYVRNFLPNLQNSIRHRFTTKPYGFTFVEPIFAITPHESIEKYIRNEEGKVVAEVISSENSYYKIFESELCKFTEDYLSLNLMDYDFCDHNLFDFISEYHLKNLNDQFIVDVYSKFEYSVNSYGDVRELAPQFNDYNIDKLSINELKSLTNNLSLSLIKSNSVSRKKYLIKCNEENVKPIKILDKKNIFPINDLGRYVKSENLPFYIKSLCENKLYATVLFEDKTVLPNTLTKDEVVEVVDIKFTNTGVPRLVTKFGLITAHQDCVAICEKSELKEVTDIFHRKTFVLEQALLVNKNIDRIDKNIQHETEIFSNEDCYSDDLENLIKPNVDVITRNFDSKELIIDNQLVNVVVDAPILKIRKDIERYISELHGKKIRTRVSLNIYKDIGLTVKTGQKIASDTLVDPLSIQWTQGGTPRIEIAEGFITSNREFVELREPAQISEIEIPVQKVRKDIERYISELHGKKIRTRVSLNIYKDIGLTVKTGQKIASDTLVDPLSIQWTQGGTPRIEIAEGFITSNREFVEFSKLECISEINISVPVQDTKSNNELVTLKMISNLLDKLKNKM